MIEGQKVAYAGDTDPFNQVGSLGKVVALSGSAAHVQWQSGPKTGQIDLVEQHELVEAKGQTIRPQGGSMNAQETFGYSLDMPGTPPLQVRATYDETGEEGLLNALSEHGHLAMLSEYVDEAVGHIAARIRQDPTLGEVLSQLEPDEADGLVGRVASVLLTDRLGDEG